MAERAAERTTATFALMNVAFMVVASAVAAWALYPVYASPRYVAVAVAGIGSAAVIVLLSHRFRWNGFVAAGLAVAAFVAAGITLAIPGVIDGTIPLTTALRELARGPVTGWKDIVTLPLPLGDYGATLVPVLALSVAGTLLSGWLAVRARRWWGFAALVAVWMVVTAIVVGPATRALPLTWAPYGLYVTREFIVGLAAFAVLLAWLGWRSAYARHAAVARATGGARLATAPRARAAGLAVAAAVMGAVAVTVSAIVSGPVAAQTPRSVARSVIDPQLVVDSTVTPLAGYRTYFADEAYDEVLFTVDVTKGDVARVRLATLPYFDGDSFTASAPSGAVPARFQHVPASITAPPDSVSVRAEIRIEGQTGVWVPIIGDLGSITFHGRDAGELVDAFYYEPTMRTGLIAADPGIRAGDAYTVDAYVPSVQPPLEALGRAPGGAVIDSSLIPASLTQWVTRQGVTHDGAGLASLVQQLRERGYLSHALTEPVTTAKWERSLGTYAFAASAAGHSYDRIDRLFTELSERESQVGAESDASLVAAVGDDEQFAAAVALVASELGFPSRVVLGARLADTDGNGWAVPACQDGVCRGRNMAVWTEVQSATGAWVPIDVTPQHATPPSPDVTQQQDPKFASALDPERAEPIVPPSSQRGSVTDTEPQTTTTEQTWNWLTPALRAAAISTLGVLILFGPFIAVLVWKALRRRRRRHGDPRDAIHHGWDEYLDTAVDAGLPPLPMATRREAALAYGSPNGVRLAELTDRATFDTSVAVAEEAEEFWELIAAERDAWLRSRGFWARTRMRLSMRSVWHSVTAQTAEAIPESTAHSPHVPDPTTRTDALLRRRGRTKG